jgi:hypothetical protein
MSTIKIRNVLRDQSALLLLASLPTTQLSASPLVLPLFDIPTLKDIDFGHYPILQFGLVAIAFIVTVAGLLGWKRGERLGKEAAANVAPVAELHFDGPIKGIFDALSDIKARQLLARLEIKDDMAVLLSGSRNMIIDRLGVLQSENREVVEKNIRDHEASMERRFSDVNTNINSLHARLDDIMKSQAHIEGALPRRRS